MSDPTGAPPRRIGRYEVSGVLGRGAMGKVFLARDTAIDRLVALKVLETDLVPRDTGGTNAVQRFLREAQAAGRLLHPGIVTIFDVGEVKDENVAYIAMEYVEGDSLYALVRRKERVSPRAVVRIGLELARALAYAHSRGVIHRDIKPANILRTTDGHVKIADFGIAKLETSSLTLDGTFLGSPQYVSPEQARTRPVDARSDLFSLGLVLYELLAGKQAFPGQAVGDVIYRILHEEPEPLAEAVPGLPEALTTCVARLLKKAPEDRYPSADQLATVLEHIQRTAFPGEGEDEDQTKPLAAVSLAPRTDPPSAADLQPTSELTPPPAAVRQIGGFDPAAAVSRPAAPRRGIPWLLLALPAAVIAILIVLRLGTRPPAAVATPTPSPVPAASPGPGEPTRSPVARESVVAPPTAVRKPTLAPAATAPPSKPSPTVTVSPPASPPSSPPRAVVTTLLRVRHLEAKNRFVVHCEGTLSIEKDRLVFRGRDAHAWIRRDVTDLYVARDELRVLFVEPASGKSTSYRFSLPDRLAPEWHEALQRWLGRAMKVIPGRSDEYGQ